MPLEEWQGDAAPFCAIHIDHKGPLHPPSNRKTHCLLIFDSFSRYLMVYPVTNTGAQATIAAVEKWILHFGIPQFIIHDPGTAFLNTGFVHWTKELGFTLRPRTAHSPWTNGKVETQNQHTARYWRNFLNDAGTNWDSLAPKCAFAHNTSVNYTTGKTPYEIVSGTKPQIPMSVKLGLYRNKHELCCSDFCEDLPPHAHVESSTKNELLQNLLRPQLSQASLDRERDFKRIYSSTFERCREHLARFHAYRNRFELGHHLDVGQKVIYENHRQDLSKIQKLQQRGLGPFTVTEGVISTTYQIQDDKDPSIIKTVHRNHLVEYYPKEESLSAIIKEHVPHDQQNDDDFFELFLDQRIGKLNSFTEQPTEDTTSFPIRPLSSTPAILSHKRDSLTSSDSGVGSAQVFSPTLPSLLNNHHNFHRRRRLNSRQLRLQPDHLLQNNNFCGTVESPKREIQGTSELSHKILILNWLFVPSLASVIHSNRQQFVVAQQSPKFSFFLEKSLPTYLLFHSLFLVQDA